MDFCITGVGTASPRHALPQELALEIAERLCCENEKQKRIAGVVYRRAGVETRQVCVDPTEAYRWEGAPGGPTIGERMELYERHAASLAIESAKAALLDANVSSESISHLVTVSCTGFQSPGVDIALIDQLGLSRSTQRVHVGFMGCHGALNGLRVVRGLAAADPSAVVLLVATELCGLHYSYGWDPGRLVGNALFGDGSAALVGISSSGDLNPDQPEPDPSVAACGWTLSDTGSLLIADTQEMMSWRVRDQGFEMTLSPELPGLIEENLAGWLRGWLEGRGLSVDDVGAWAVHPGGPKVLDAVETAMGLPADATSVSREVLREHGNVSSATVLMVLQLLRERRAAGPVVMLGFGPGIMAEVALWR